MSRISSTSNNLLPMCRYDQYKLWSKLVETERSRKISKSCNQQPNFIAYIWSRWFNHLWPRWKNIRVSPTLLKLFIRRNNLWEVKIYSKIASFLKNGKLPKFWSRKSNGEDGGYSADRNSSRGSISDISIFTRHFNLLYPHPPQFKTFEKLFWNFLIIFPTLL